MSSISIIPLLGIVSTLYSALASAHPATPASCQYGTCDTPYRYAVLGDSWASGVSYNAKSEYDHNKDNCYRTPESYGVQLSKNNTWAGSNPHFDFPACSGSHMIDMAKGNCQVCNLQSPDLLILTIGGNDIGFYDVVDSCIYHSNKDRDYGPDYDKDPDRTGACAKAIDAASNFIAKKELFSDKLDEMYKDLFLSNQYKNNKELRIYQTGYVHYFNIEPSSDYCNGYRFNPDPLTPKRPYMSHVVRVAINDLVENANQVVQRITSSYKNKHVGYVSITERFNGHRFCEAGASWFDQYRGNATWFYNAWPEWLDPNGDFVNLYEDNSTPWPEPLFQFSKTSDKGNSEDGQWRRPFHPKAIGHEAIQGSYYCTAEGGQGAGDQDLMTVNRNEILGYLGVHRRCR